MTVEDFCVAQELIEEIHADLDLDEDGITDEEVNRRKTRIFVGGLRFGSEDHVLHDYFDQFGPIKEAVVIRDRKTGLSKGYGFVSVFANFVFVLFHKTLNICNNFVLRLL